MHRGETEGQGFIPILYSIVHYSTYFTFLLTGMIEKLKEDPNFKYLQMEACPNTGNEIDTTEKTSANHGTPIAISILATFVVTAVAVAFLTAILVLVLRTYSQKKKQKKKEVVNAYNYTSQDAEIKSSF